MMKPVHTAAQVGCGLLCHDCLAPLRSGRENSVQSCCSRGWGEVVGLKGLVGLGQGRSRRGPGSHSCHHPSLAGLVGEPACCSEDLPFEPNPPGEPGVGPCPSQPQDRGCCGMLSKELLKLRPGYILCPKLLQPDTTEAWPLIRAHLGQQFQDQRSVIRRRFSTHKTPPQVLQEGGADVPAVQPSGIAAGVPSERAGPRMTQPKRVTQVWSEGVEGPSW